MKKVAVYLHRKCYSSYVVGVINELCGIYRFANVFEYDSRSSSKDKKGRYRDFNKDIGFKDGINIFRNANVNKGILDKTVKGFHIVRDPRGMLASAAHSHKYDKNEKGWPGLSGFKEAIKDLSIGRIVRKELTFMGVFLEDMREWSPVENVTTLKAEELKAVDFLRIFKSVGLNVDIGLIELIMDKNSIERVKEEKRGMWKDHFSRLIRYEFQKKYGRLISLYGYENFN